MRLNHNTLAYAAKNNLNAINNNLTKSMQRLSSGYKINKSSDDPAGKAISRTMQTQIRGLDRAELNANDGISLIQTAEGALNEIHSILARMRELAVQAANDTYDETDRGAMQDEIEQLKDELDRISDTTDFNGRSLLNGELNKKGYTDNDDLKIVEIGGDIEAGVYGISINGTGAQAVKTITALADNATITKAQEGTLSINGFSIEIYEGMTGKEINAAIRDASAKIGIDYDMAGTLTTQQYGRKQSITVKADNEKLAELLGADGKTEYGENAKADFTKDGDERIGFEDTATIDTEGNRVTVTDKNGFKMVYDIDPEASAGDVNVTVLSAGPMVFQIGNNEGQVLNVNIGKTTADSLDIETINIYTNGYATDAIGRIDAAVDKISSIRSGLGAFQNRLDYTVTNLQTANENLTSAVSRIMDSDMADEITEYTQQNVLSQSALQMLMKSNARPEGLLQLFQR
ncbi:MAG: flagellar hook-associated protein FlgL [Lachnospiraceae bacterium]|nr:flagellar hook-associated protein FlgL [Lachnospiraceae bacterium]